MELDRSTLAITPPSLQQKQENVEYKYAIMHSDSDTEILFVSMSMLYFNSTVITSQKAGTIQSLSQHCACIGHTMQEDFPVLHPMLLVLTAIFARWESLRSMIQL